MDQERPLKSVPATERDWENWRYARRYGELLRDRAQGKYQEMEYCKFLRKLIAIDYRQGDAVLEIGSGAGHIYASLRRQFPGLDYTGIDITPSYVEMANELFCREPNARFLLGDLYQPHLPRSQYDLVICYNVLLHLPDYQLPLARLLDLTSRVLFIRTSLAQTTTIRRDHRSARVIDPGYEDRTSFYNTYAVGEFTEFIHTQGKWDVDVLDEEFDLSVLTTEENDDATYVKDGQQYFRGVPCNWKIVRVRAESQ